jgi:hypothetical protein
MTLEDANIWAISAAARQHSPASLLHISWPGVSETADFHSVASHY